MIFYCSIDRSTMMRVRECCVLACFPLFFRSTPLFSQFFVLSLCCTTRTCRLHAVCSVCTAFEFYCDHRQGHTVYHRLQFFIRFFSRSRVVSSFSFGGFHVHFYSLLFASKFVALGKTDFCAFLSTMISDSHAAAGFMPGRTDGNGLNYT